ncbi:2Fe-2S iron-sulfur cluster binding domain-containing protein [Aromatoleum toluvorans]|uniref:2Fe-2S iron-sulfur cluster binding domain-containing protein n=1 Tax=Aromatoleum toluvorans TaxID=92002 RepID=A0ABX1PXG8_9RHOO|nr:2Fe-2S iron-sulfur cluster binding domain-containing protein [Aromatoleum toluvorans]
MKFAITIEDTSERYDCAPDESLLAGMVRLGRRGIPAGCCGGGCGVCKVEIIAGAFEARAMSRDHVSAAEQAEGRVLACRVYPRSDVTLRVLGKMQKTVCSKKVVEQAERRAS